MDTQTSIQNVVSELSNLINMNLRTLSGEQYQPSMDPDMSDEMMSIAKTKVIKLREIRTQFENTMSDVVL